MTTKSFHLIGAKNIVENTILIDPDNVGFIEILQKDYTLVEATSGSIGECYDAVTGTFNPPAPPTLDKEGLLTALAAIRYEREVGGITINGTRYSTSRTSQGLINGAYNAARDSTDPNKLFDFVPDDNTALILTVPEVISLGETMYRHVQACFTTQSTFINQINTGEANFQSSDEVAIAFDAYYTSLMAVS